MSLTDTGENFMLNAFQVAGPYFLALFTALPDEAGNATEVTGGGYARQGVSFGPVAEGSMSTDAIIEFPTVIADWGVVTHWGLYTAETGGDLMWNGEVSPNREMVEGDIYRVSVGKLTLSME